MIMASGAVTAAMSRPPIAGPAMPDADCVVDCNELAWTYWCRVTSRTKKGWEAVPPSTPPTPRRTAEAYSSGMVTRPSACSTGTVAIAAAWINAAAMSTSRLLGRWSTQVPIGSANRLGIHSAAVNAATAVALACSDVVAINGNARPVI